MREVDEARVRESMETVAVKFIRRQLGKQQESVDANHIIREIEKIRLEPDQATRIGRKTIRPKYLQ